MFTRNRTHILLGFLFIIIPILSSFDGELRNYLQYSGKLELENHYKEIISRIEEDRYKLTKFLGSGSYGVVFSASYRNKILAIKIMEVRSQKECEEHSIINEMKNAGARYLISLFKNQFVEMDKNNKKVNFCLLFLEGGLQSLEKPIFTAESDKSENSKVLGQIFSKIIESVYSLNSIAGYLHADLKPANIIVTKSSEYRLEPRIIDFDLVMKRKDFIKKSGIVRPEFVVYTVRYRPPEIRFFCPSTNCDMEPNDINDQRADYYYQYYVFNNEFKEDAYAIGKTLADIYEINQEFINESDEFLNLTLLNIIQNLKNHNVAKRWSTFEAHKYLKKHIEENNIDFKIAKEVIPVKIFENDLKLKDKKEDALTEPSENNSSGSSSKSNHNFPLLVESKGKQNENIVSARKPAFSIIPKSGENADSSKSRKVTENLFRSVDRTELRKIELQQKSVSRNPLGLKRDDLAKITDTYLLPNLPRVNKNPIKVNTMIAV
jgi:serine/threonine protein kinase